MTRSSSEDHSAKSTVAEIRARFDADVERFSNLETGQSATIDAPLVLDLLPRVALAVTPRATHFLDIGCGAGNFSLKMRELAPELEVTLIDLSQPMIDRALSRLGGKTAALCGDIRDVELPEGQFDIAVAAASLHHLRSEGEWRSVFGKVFRSLRSGGGFWIADLVEHSIPAVEREMWSRYGEYLETLGGVEYRNKVFTYIAKEDSPRALLWQLDMLRQCGFAGVDILHKNGPFAAFGGIKN